MQTVVGGCLLVAMEVEGRFAGRVVVFIREDTGRFVEREHCVVVVGGTVGEAVC